MSIIVYQEVATPIVPTPLELQIVSLFARGEWGGAWDFTRPDRLFQDAGGTLLVATYGDPIGMAMDLSGNGKHLSQATTAARPTYTVDGALHDGVDDFLMAANAGDWTFLHDGSGGTLGVCGSYEAGGNGVLATGTTGTAGASVGLSTGVQSGSVPRGFARTGNGTEGVSAWGVTGDSPPSVPTSHVASLVEKSLSLSINGTVRNTTLVDFPAADSPALNPLRTSISHNAGSVRSVRRIIAISRVLTESELDLVNAWLTEGVE